MVEYLFEVVNVTPVKGQKLAGSKDYDTRVVVRRNGKMIFDQVIRVRKNRAGIFPDPEPIRKKIAAPALQKELTEKIKTFIKKQK